MRHLGHSSRLFGHAAPALLAVGVAAACTSTSVTSVAPSSGKCQVTADASPVEFAASGGRGTLTVRAERDCGWTVAPQAPWLVVASERSGHGDATLSYTVASNPRPAARAGELLVEGTRLQLTQAGAPCTFRLSRSDEAVGATGGTVAFSIETLEGCSWNTSTDASWLRVVSGSSGTASAAIEVQVDANSGAARSGGVRVATERFAVTQGAGTTPPSSPGPSPTPSPAPAPPPSPTPSPAPSPSPPPSPPPPTPAPIALQGFVSGLSGSCPAVRFVVEGHTVFTTRSTSFDRRCRDLDNGDTVRVSGLTQPNGTVDASEVEITRNAR